MPGHTHYWYVRYTLKDGREYEFPATFGRKREARDITSLIKQRREVVRAQYVFCCEAQAA